MTPLETPALSTPTRDAWLNLADAASKVLLEMNTSRQAQFLKILGPCGSVPPLSLLNSHNWPCVVNNETHKICLIKNIVDLVKFIFKALGALFTCNRLVKFPNWSESVTNTKKCADFYISYSPESKNALSYKIEQILLMTFVAEDSKHYIEPVCKKFLKELDDSPEVIIEKFEIGLTEHITSSNIRGELDRIYGIRIIAWPKITPKSLDYLPPIRLQTHLEFRIPL